MTLSRHTTGGILPWKACATKLATCVLPFSSVQDRIYTLDKASMHCTPSRRSFPSVSFKTVPVLTLSCLSKRILLLSASSFFASLLQAVSGTWIWQSVLSSFSVLQMLWATSHLWRLLCMVCLSAWSFPFTWACPRQYVYGSLFDCDVKGVMMMMWNP